jgi:hypothetical protein
VQHHVESEQQRERRSGSVIIGDNFRDEKHAAVAQRPGASLDESLPGYASFAMDDVAENHEVITVAAEVYLAQYHAHPQGDLYETPSSRPD